MNALKIEFGIQANLLKPDTEKSTTWLSFEVLPGTFPQQWAAAFAREISRKSLWHFNFGSLFVNEPYYRDKIAKGLKDIRESHSGKQAMRITESEITPYTRRKVLESILQDCAEIQTAQNGKVSKNATELSELVRHYLQIYNPEFHFHVSLQAYLPQAYHLPKEALSLFTCDRKDGWLYLDYIGEGQDSLSCYNEKSVSNHEPQRFFSGNSQILYRENFDGGMLKADVTNWLHTNNQQSESIGLIPLARPLHSFSRTEVRDLFSKSDSTVKIRIYRNGVATSPALFESGQSLPRPYYSDDPIRAAIQAVGLGLLRVTRLDRPVNFLVDWYHRYGVSLWIVKQPYYWIRPRAFRAYFTLSWPIRKMFYFAKFQFEKRILRSLK